MKKNTTLGLAMIVRNEEEVLARCLGSVSGLVDELVVVDTGSTDRTVEIAKEFGAKVYHFEWIDDFAAARNFSFSKIKSDWIWWIDADDVIPEENHPKFKVLREALDSGKYDCVEMPYYYQMGLEGKPASQLPTDRIIPKSLGPVWAEPIHECLCIPPGFRKFKFDAPIHHYRTSKSVVADSGRNLRILEKTYRSGKASARIKFYYGKDLYEHAHYKDAIPVLKDYLKMKGDIGYHMEALWRLAWSLEEEGRRDEAREIALNAIYLDDTWVEPYVTLARCALDAKNYESAIRWARRAMDMPHPKLSVVVRQSHYDYLPRSTLMLALNGAGRVEEAQRVNDELRQMAPGDQRYIDNENLFSTLGGKKRFSGKDTFRLNIGCGQSRLPGWWNSDSSNSVYADEVFEPDNIPYGNGSVDEIYSDGALTRLKNSSARRAFREFARVLKPGGALHLKVTDLEETARAYASSKNSDEHSWYLKSIYGDEEQPHLTGFHKMEVKDLLEGNGFVIHEICSRNESKIPELEIRARKPSRSEAIVWLCPSNMEAVQSRLRVLNVHNAAISKGYKSVVTTSWEDLKGHPFVVIGNPFVPDSKERVQELRKSGSVVVGDLCEDLFDLIPSLAEDVKSYDLVVCSSYVLAEKVRAAGGRAEVVEDMVESPEEDFCQYEPQSKLKVVWCGYGGGTPLVEELSPLIESKGMELVTVHEWEGATHPWNRGTWSKILAECDIAIAPFNPKQPAKGQVKVAQYMGLGLPTIVGPLDSYTRLVEEGVTGFVARDESGWDNALETLKDWRVRARVGRAGKLRVQTFRAGPTADRWWDLAKDLLLKGPEAPSASVDYVRNQDEDTVDLIMTTFNCLEYTKRAVYSLKKCAGEVPFQIHIVDAGSTDGTQDWVKQQKGLILHGGEKRRNFAQAVNLGIQETQGKWFVILNNDLIFSPGWLDEMLATAQSRDRCAAVGVLSNCDIGWVIPPDSPYAKEMVVEDYPLHPKIRIGDIEVHPIMEYGKKSNEKHKGEVKEQEWVAFYCTLMSREALAEVGELDEEFKTGGEDIDLCRRLRKAGYNICQAYGAFVFHWGAVSREDDQNHRRDEYNAEDAYNNLRVRDKWKRENLVIYAGPAWEEWTPENIDQKGIGGSETCAAKLAYEFSLKGWRVTVFGECPTQAGLYDGVEYRDWRTFDVYARRNWMDYFIALRTTEPFRLPVLHTGVSAVWVHDIWLGKDRQTPLREDKVDVFAVLSPWHKKYFKSHHTAAPEDKLWIVPDGVDLSRFENPDKSEWSPYRMHYSSSPDRGLWVLLKAFPELRKRVPQAELHVYYGFDNWDKAIDARGTDLEKAHRDDIKKLMAQEGVHYHGRIGQADLAREFMKSNIWAYPTWFWETFCITAVESMLAGAVPITTDLAALNTTVGEHGLLLPDPPTYFPTTSETYTHQWVDLAEKVMKNPDRYSELREKARQRAQESFGWSHVADLWDEKYRSVVQNKASRV